MIFVTVGTHEQPFDRLFDELAALKRLHPELEFFCQYGASEPRSALPGAPFLPAPEIARLISDAQLVITHGGPGSIIPVIAQEKPVVLVPRTRAYDEHVDDHQVAFCTRIADTYGITMVTDMSDLGEAIQAAQSPRSPGDGGADVAVTRLAGLIEAQLRTPTRWGRRVSRGGR